MSLPALVSASRSGASRFRPARPKRNRPATASTSSTSAASSSLRNPATGDLALRGGMTGGFYGLRYKLSFIEGSSPQRPLTSPALLSPRERREKNKFFGSVSPLSLGERGARGVRGPAGCPPAAARVRRG